MLGEELNFADLAEMEHALHGGAVHLHAKVKARIETFDDEGSKVKKVVESTPGRLRLAQYLPDSANIPFETINKLMTKEISNVIDNVPPLRTERYSYIRRSVDGTWI